nr:ribulose-phosphate 3-epimerase [Maliibacterium massiliense]
MSEQKRILVSPSILAADFAALGAAAQRAEAAGADMLHVDVMDGQFVPNISFGQDMVRALKAYTSLPLDVHLMITDADSKAQRFAEAGADIVTFHVEAALHTHRVLSNLRRAGCRAGVALNPATPLETLSYILPDVDMVLIMTVNPGFGGQTYIPAMFDKIKTLRRWIDAGGYNVDIEVDGGVTLENAHLFSDAGANVLVGGTCIFKADDMARAVRALKKGAGR